jgi:hypothetical protein
MLGVAGQKSSMHKTTNIGALARGKMQSVVNLEHQINSNIEQ